MTVAFLYKWIEISTDKWYIGSRTANGCHPTDGYICSSKIVKPLIRKKTGPCSEIRREAIRASLKGKHTLPLITCPHCNLEGRSNMQQWHFDNCRSLKCS